MICHLRTSQINQTISAGSYEQLDIETMYTQKKMVEAW